VTSTTAPSRDTATGPRPIAVIGAIFAVLAVAVALVVALVHHPSSEAATAAGDRHHVWEYTVPFGTGARLDAGETVEFFPYQLVVHVGDQLIVHNLDNRSQEIGPYYVDRGETMEQVFTQPGTITGVCTIHPSGRVVIDVLP
jgi:plastocyanin